MTRRSLLTKAAIGLPAMGVVGALTWANPASTPEASALTVDGIWGHKTTVALQSYFGTPIDGIVSGQEPSLRGANSALGSGWDWSGNGGSYLISAIQSNLNVSNDGYFGPRTAQAWHVALGLRPYPYFDLSSPAVSEIQWRLANGRRLFG
ncbi:MAG: peptidoglycan-binding protein [Propionibacteriaceae bacterium]|nr:peptidoglycan-binding protein [Propionibacteriaceae bacterium]